MKVGNILQTRLQNASPVLEPVENQALASVAAENNNYPDAFSLGFDTNSVLLIYARLTRALEAICANCASRQTYILFVSPSPVGVIFPVVPPLTRRRARRQPIPKDL